MIGPSKAHPRIILGPKHNFSQDLEANATNHSALVLIIKQENEIKGSQIRKEKTPGTKK